jgi:type IV pilus biogenesis protein CpaD/CtpE
MIGEEAMSTMTRRTRTTSATALCAAALVALLSACAQTDSTPTARVDETKPTATAEVNGQEAMPEVVIVASRERPDSRG